MIVRCNTYTVLLLAAVRSETSCRLWSTTTGIQLARVTDHMDMYCIWRQAREIDSVNVNKNTKKLRSIGREIYSISKLDLKRGTKQENNQKQQKNRKRRANESPKKEQNNRNNNKNNDKTTIFRFPILIFPFSC